MAAIDMAGTMDALAAKLVAGNVTKRAHAWPAASVSVPCAVVGYPTELDFDLTYQRGSDRAVFPVFMLMGNVADRSARDALSTTITGAAGIKDALDGPLSESLGGSVRVTDCAVEQVAIGEVQYLSATFSVEVLT